LPACVRTYLGSPLGIAYLSQESLAHILRDHPKTDLLEMLCLPAMLAKGHWVGDRAKAACVFYRDPASGRIFKSAVKCVAGFEIYVTTFHICTEKQTRSIIKRGATLQVQK